MKIMWICGGLLPDACATMGVDDIRINGGFMGATFSSLKECDGNNEFCVLSWDKRACDVVVGNVRHVSFGGCRKLVSQVPRRDCFVARRNIEEFCPDVVHILGTEGAFANLPKEVFCGHPVVVSMQGIIAACAINYAGGLTPKELRGTNLNYSFLRYGVTVLNEQARWMSLRRASEEQVIKRHDYFIGRTDFDHSWVRYYNPSARYFHVNETLRPEFYGVERNECDVRRHSIFCGGASAYPLKGCHWLIKALIPLRKLYPDIRLRVANALNIKSAAGIRGLREGSYSHYLHRLICDLDLWENIELLPALSASEVVDELRHAELFVLPSTCENSPNALCEAMLVGTPSIAMSVGGIPSILSDYQTGRFVPPADPALLASAIADLFNNPDEAREFAKKAKRVAIERHDPRVNASSLMSVYQEIVRECK